MRRSTSSAACTCVRRAPADAADRAPGMTLRQVSALSIDSVTDPAEPRPTRCTSSGSRAGSNPFSDCAMAGAARGGLVIRLSARASSRGRWPDPRGGRWRGWRIRRPVASLDVGERPAARRRRPRPSRRCSTASGSAPMGIRGGGVRAGALRPAATTPAATPHGRAEPVHRRPEYSSIWAVRSSGYEIWTSVISPLAVADGLEARLHEAGVGRHLQAIHARDDLVAQRRIEVDAVGLEQRLRRLVVPFRLDPLHVARAAGRRPPGTP